MTTSEFKAYKARYREILRRVLQASERGRLSEAAFPAYTHTNPLINWLFWQRLRVAMDYVEMDAPYRLVLDFGCGSGIMLPFLSQRSERVIALDTDLMPLELVKRHHPLPENVQVFDAGRRPLSELQGNLDLIVALDVLEHVPDLVHALQALFSRLRAGGKMLVSGPTENMFYRIGRALAGPEYSGDYHKRSVADIRRKIEEMYPIERSSVLYPPVPLFEVFVAAKN